MAKYEINYKCGHTGTVQLFGPGKDRDRKIEWLRDQDCPRCQKIEQGLECRIVLMGDRIEVQFIGDTYPHKDNIKALGGYRFSKDLVAGMLSVKPQTGWFKSLKIGDTEIPTEIDKIKNQFGLDPKMEGNILDILTTQAVMES